MQFAGLILAGGQGKRYGCPKAFATLPDGRSFLAACREYLAHAGASPIIATLPPNPALGDLGGIVPATLPRDGLEMMDSLRIGLGEALKYREWTGIIVAPVDHPLVKRETVLTLAAALENARAAVPSYQDLRGHPIALQRSLAAAIVARSIDGATLRDVLRHIEPKVISVDDPGVLANCNTPQTLDENFNPS